MAQAAGMSTEAFEDLYFDVCTLDYRKMARAMVPLHRRMKRADRVRIQGPGTDLAFSIKGIGAQMCKGDRNIPDGEVFSCPVKDSINGRIQFNTPTLYSGTKFENVCLEFKHGRISKATASNSRRFMIRSITAPRPSTARPPAASRPPAFSAPPATAA